MDSVCHGSQPVRGPWCAWQERLLKENTDLLVRREVSLVRTMRRHCVAISLIVQEVWLLGNLNSKESGQSRTSQPIVPLLKYEIDELVVLLDK